MMPVHPNTPKQRAGEARKGSLETLIGLPGLCKKKSPRACVFLWSCSQVLCFGKCQAEVESWASDFGLKKVVAATSVVCGCQ